MTLNDFHEELAHTVTLVDQDKSKIQNRLDELEMELQKIKSSPPKVVNGEQKPKELHFDFYCMQSQKERDSKNIILEGLYEERDEVTIT